MVFAPALDVGVGDVDVMVGGYHEYHARLQRLVFGHGAHGQRAPAREDILQVADPAGLEVLGYDDGSRKIFGQGGDQLREGFHASGGATDNHQVRERVVGGVGQYRSPSVRY